MTKTLAVGTTKLLESLPLNYQDEEPNSWLRISPDPGLAWTDRNATRNSSSARIGQLDDLSLLHRTELNWGEIVIASQETSFAFLADEPDIYDENDGEPV